MDLSVYSTGGLSVYGNYVIGATLDACVAKGTWTASGTWTIPAVTLGGAIAAGDQSWTGVGNMTFTAGSILASGSTNTDTLLLRANDTTFITFTTGATDVCTMNAITMSGTWLASGTVTLPAVTLGANVTINGKIFDAGAGAARINTTGSGFGLDVYQTNDGNVGARVGFYGVSASPANNDSIAELYVQGKNDAPADQGYGWLKFLIENVANATPAGKFQITLMDTTWNTALTLSGAGVLAVDLGGSGSAAQVDLFDDYDDALVLKQGIQQNNRELLADMGILDRKDSGSGYMMKVQPMIRLLAGGIYQTRQMLEDTVTNLTEKIDLLENKIKLIEG